MFEYRKYDKINTSRRKICILVRLFWWDIFKWFPTYSEEGNKLLKSFEERGVFSIHNIEPKRIPWKDGHKIRHKHVANSVKPHVMF